MLLCGSDDRFKGIIGLLAFECEFGQAVSTSAHDADESTQRANEGYFAGFPLPEVGKD